jgi:hypothetical protein
MNALNIKLVATLLIMAYANEGEGTGANTGANTGTGGGEGTPKTFTQEDLNRVAAEERRKATETQKKLVGEIDALRGRSTLTEQEKLDLENRVTELSKTLMTKEELMKQEQDKAAKRAAQERDQLTSEANTWKTRFTEKTINGSIISEAATNEAINPQQLVAILRPNTRLVEVLEDGKPTGEYETVVTYQTKDDKGKPVKLDLPVGDAIKKMKEDSNYMNLFKGTGTGGIGGQNRGGGSGGGTTLASVAHDPVAYREARKKMSL